jgi:hypothetical protein
MSLEFCAAADSDVGWRLGRQSAPIVAAVRRLPARESA